MITYDIEKHCKNSSRKFSKYTLPEKNLLNTYCIPILFTCITCTCTFNPCMFLCSFVNTYVEHELHVLGWIEKRKNEIIAFTCYLFTKCDM